MKLAPINVQYKPVSGIVNNAPAGKVENGTSFQGKKKDKDIKPCCNQQLAAALMALTLAVGMTGCASKGDRNVVIENRYIDLRGAEVYETHGNDAPVPNIVSYVGDTPISQATSWTENTELESLKNVALKPEKIEELTKAFVDDFNKNLDEIKDQAYPEDETALTKEWGLGKFETNFTRDRMFITKSLDEKGDESFQAYVILGNRHAGDQAVKVNLDTTTGEATSFERYLPFPNEKAGEHNCPTCVELAKEGRECHDDDFKHLPGCCEEPDNLNAIARHEFDTKGLGDDFNGHVSFSIGDGPDKGEYRTIFHSNGAVASVVKIIKDEANPDEFSCEYMNFALTGPGKHS
ncbi:hypothetical protein tpqmel_0632 [Candidatus Gastranaerophilus sp. (ex Termes propinquus)]|nr:hypothetical protein tpqmel_0632 [Candidatus Gastranaerophilus sp. (ex Termes propinquus)]